MKLIGHTGCDLALNLEKVKLKWIAKKQTKVSQCINEPRVEIIYSSGSSLSLRWLIPDFARQPWRNCYILFLFWDSCLSVGGLILLHLCQTKRQVLLWMRFWLRFSFENHFFSLNWKTEGTTKVWRLLFYPFTGKGSMVNYKKTNVLKDFNLNDKDWYLL